ncbi:Uncharacterized protein LOK49_LG04G03815 [Camellia lanceoleosa]|uniref:Uncharacterized protein n=1 Tax=Camellia lanceoleosa TaxID=1840588 RepID=A0ACC0HY28_9ERIC|nr:Uncharacterized protein LOK49_LG04G03815 [Camellia lanceoleosa]
MGCATSKPRVCRNCQPPPPVPQRSYSINVHHPPQQEGDSYHVVALTSTTLGSLKLNHKHLTCEEEEEAIAPLKDDEDYKRKTEFSMGVIEAKTWSQMINRKIPKIVPKTPITTPPGEPETINIWELMAGLEDTSPLRPVHHHHRSFSFPVNSIPDSKPQETEESKPMWLQIADNSNATSIISEFDPDVISKFREALEDLPPENPIHVNPLECTDVKKIDVDFPDYKGFKDRVVLYFTSLRGVRKTYEDCCHVRVILKGIGVRVDERDVSMHSGFKEELRELLGDGFYGGGLPRVFVGKKYIGGAEEIRQLHEEGRLEKVLDGCEWVVGGGGGGGGGVCEACGDIRFVPCETCSGSCKIYYEVDYDDDDDDDQEFGDESDCGFHRCPDCNENGITRCPVCCD